MPDISPEELKFSSAENHDSFTPSVPVPEEPSSPPEPTEPPPPGVFVDEPPTEIQARVGNAQARLGMTAWGLIFSARNYMVMELAKINNHGSVRARQFRSFILEADLELGLAVYQPRPEDPVIQVP